METMNNEEINMQNIYVADNENEKIIRGTAIVFNQISQILYFENGFKAREIIKPEAITQELLNNQDIVVQYNHDKNIVLARSNKGKGTLKLFRTEKGVDFEFPVRNTSFSNEIYEAIKAGDLNKMSFGFLAAEGGVIISMMPDGIYLRTVIKIEKISEFSIVTQPAYVNTEVSARFDKELKEFEFKEIQAKQEEINKQEEQKRLAEELKKKADHKKFEQYVNTLKNKYLMN